MRTLLLLSVLTRLLWTKPRVRGLMKPMEGHEYDMNINSNCRIELAAVVAYLLLDDGRRMLACAFISI